MPELLKIALTTFGSALAAVAIPTAIFLVWIPREFDSLEDGISSNGAAISKVLIEIDNVRESLDGLNEKIDGSLLKAELSTTMIGYLAAILDKEKTVLSQILASHLPIQDARDWESLGKLDYLYGAVVNGEEFIFVDLADAPKMAAQDIEFLRTISESEGVRFRSPTHKIATKYATKRAEQRRGSYHRVCRIWLQSRGSA